MRAEASGDLPIADDFGFSTSNSFAVDGHNPSNDFGDDFDFFSEPPEAKKENPKWATTENIKDTVLGRSDRSGRSSPTTSDHREQLSRMRKDSDKLYDSDDDTNATWMEESWIGASGTGFVGGSSRRRSGASSQGKGKEKRKKKKKKKSKPEKAKKKESMANANHGAFVDDFGDFGSSGGFDVGFGDFDAFDTNSNEPNEQEDFFDFKSKTIAPSMNNMEPQLISQPQMSMQPQTNTQTFQMNTGNMLAQLQLQQQPQNAHASQQKQNDDPFGLFS